MQSGLLSKAIAFHINAIMSWNKATETYGASWKKDHHIAISNIPTEYGY